MGIGIGTALIASSVLGIGASMYSASQAGGGDYDVAPPPEEPFLDTALGDTTSEGVKTDIINEKMENLRKRNASRAKFISTSGQGLLADAPTKKKSLLGR